MEREEDGPLGRDGPPAGSGPPENRVREVPAEVHSSHRVAQPVRRVGQEDRASSGPGGGRASGTSQPTLRLARRHDDLGARRLEKHFPKTRRDVVDVRRLPDAVVKGPGVAPSVPGVDDDAYAREAAGFRGRGEECGLGPLLLARGRLRVVRRQVLLGEVLERDLHREADRDPVDVVDPRPQGDLQGELDDVLGVQTPGEPHDDGRVERFLLPEPVDREPAPARPSRTRGEAAPRRESARRRGTAGRRYSTGTLTSVPCVAAASLSPFSCASRPARPASPVNQVAIEESGSVPTATCSQPIVALASDGKRARTAARRVSSERLAYGRRTVRVRDGGAGNARSLSAAASSREIRLAKSATASPSSGRTSTAIAPPSRTAEKSSETSTRLTVS